MVRKDGRRVKRDDEELLRKPEQPPAAYSKHAYAPKSCGRRLFILTLRTRP
jgi:hypothetical protein